MKFLNVLFAGDKMLVKDKSPQDLEKIIEVLRESGWEIFLIPNRE